MNAISRKLVLALVVAFALVGSSVVFADDQQQAPAAGQALSSEDVASAREQLKTIADAFGVESSTPVAQQPVATNPQPAQVPAGEHKTLGDAADKALELVGKAVASISTTLQNVAPRVWAIMIRQQYAKAIGLLVVPWGLLAVVLVYYRVISSKWQAPSDKPSGNDAYVTHLILTKILPVVMGSCCAIWGVIRVSDSIMYLLNPEYYAVRDIISMLLGKPI